MIKKANYIVRFGCLALFIFLTLNTVFNFIEDDYTLTFTGIVNIGLAVLVTFIPKILETFNIKISNTLYILSLISICISSVGGITLKWYVKTTYMDKVAHTYNGALLALLAFAFVKLRYENNGIGMVDLIIASVIISLALGAFWEIYEFFVDGIVSGSNMQRFRDVNDPLNLFVGREALMDTMMDLVVDTIGALIAAALLFISNKRNKKFINLISFEKVHKL